MAEMVSMLKTASDDHSAHQNIDSNDQWLFKAGRQRSLFLGKGESVVRRRGPHRIIVMASL